MTRTVLVITGAGASTLLGKAKKPIPMMKEWATSLHQGLGSRAQQLRISPDMDGAAFEAALGRFLAFATALPNVREFGYLGTPGRPGMGIPQTFNQWWAAADAAVKDITDALRSNLFENFSRNRVDDTRAKTAYETLHHDGLRWDADTRIWHATTNFDVAIEVAVAQDDRLRLVNGFTSPPGSGTGMYSPDLLAAAMTDDQHNQVPVVHVHGAVGWYYDAQNQIELGSSDRPYAPGRTPALMLPDDQKNPLNFSPGLDTTWSLFLSMVREATHIVVLGHSLFDEHLAAALREWEGRHLAYFLYRHEFHEKYGLQLPTDEERESWRFRLGREITLIPCKFGAEEPKHDDFDVADLREWATREP